MDFAKCFLVCLGLLFTSQAVYAQQSPLSLPDPYTLTAIPALNGVVNQNTKATSLRTPQALNPAVRNLVIVAAGQSNLSDTAPSAYSPANGSVIDCFNIYDGGSYVAADPQLGTTITVTGHPAFRLADSLITANLFDRVVIVPIAIGGTSAANWDTGVESTRFAVAFSRLSSRGMVAGTNITVIVIWGQGETDNQLGTAQAAYTASLNDIIAQTRAAGFTGLWFVAEQTWISGAASSTIEAAQAAVVNHSANVWAGPNADALTGSACSGVACRQADNTHWSDAGSASYASAWQTALVASGAPF